MKRFVLILFFLVSGILSYAQDVILTNNGSRIYCTVLEVANGKVYYGIGRDITRYSIDQSQVKEIKYAQVINQSQSLPQSQTNMSPDLQQTFTVGFLEGGGGLVGIDWEFLVAKRLGIQVGTGLVSIGASVNVHLRPDIRSSFVALQYWHQGFGENYVQSLIGPSYVFRARKVFTAQVGFGYALGKGPAWPADQQQPSTMLTYAIGIYFPIKGY